jgi:hypothetical protein
MSSRKISSNPISNPQGVKTRPPSIGIEKKSSIIGSASKSDPFTLPHSNLSPKSIIADNKRPSISKTSPTKTVYSYEKPKSKTILSTKANSTYGNTYSYKAESINSPSDISLDPLSLSSSLSDDEISNRKQSYDADRYNDSISASNPLSDEMMVSPLQSFHNSGSFKSNKASLLLLSKSPTYSSAASFYSVISSSLPGSHRSSNSKSITINDLLEMNFDRKVENVIRIFQLPI